MKLVIRILLLSLFAGTATAAEGSRAYIAFQPFGQTFSGSATALEQTGGLSRSNTYGGSLGFSMNDYLMLDLISVNYADLDYSSNASSTSVSTVNGCACIAGGTWGVRSGVPKSGSVGAIVHPYFGCLGSGFAAFC